MTITSPHRPMFWLKELENKISVNTCKYLRGNEQQEYSVADFGTLNRALWAGNLYVIVISGFRVCFVNNCIEKNQNKTYFEEGTSESPQDEKDEFSEKCQTAFDPHPSKPSKIGVTIYGCIYASRYESQIVTFFKGGGTQKCFLQSMSCFDFSQYHCWKSIPWTLKWLLCIHFHA